MERIDILVKGVPVPVHNMFKGICSMTGKTVSEGIIEVMTAYVQKASGGEAADPAPGGKKKR
jgi:hypothetical protein